MGRRLRLGGALRDRRVGAARRRGHGDRAHPARHAAHSGLEAPSVGPRLEGRFRRPDQRRAGGHDGRPGGAAPGWTAFEPDEGRAVRAKKLDEGLAVWAGLLEDAGSFTFEGHHYSAGANDFMLPPPTPQRPTRRCGSSARGRPVAGNARSSGPPAGKVSCRRSTRRSTGRPSPSRTSRRSSTGCAGSAASAAALGGLRRRHRGRLLGLVHLAPTRRPDGVGGRRGDVVGRELVGRAAGARRPRRGAESGRGRPPLLS